MGGGHDHFLPLLMARRADTPFFQERQAIGHRHIFPIPINLLGDTAPLSGTSPLPKKRKAEVMVPSPSSSWKGDGDGHGHALPLLKIRGAETMATFPIVLHHFFQKRDEGNHD